MLEVSIRSRSGAPSRKGLVVNGQITTASNEYAPPSSIPYLGVKCHILFFVRLATCVEADWLRLPRIRIGLHDVIRASVFGGA